MPRFAIAFHSESKGTSVQVIEASTRDQAIRAFFNQMSGTYSKDSEGFAYFCEDFQDEKCPMGAILELEF